MSASWAVPADAVSGIHIARLVREDDDPPTWRPDNGRVVTADATQARAGAARYGALGLGKLANALREPRASHIYFVVRDDASRADMLFQTSDTTWTAYNREGITSTYGSFDPARPMERAYKVSLNRPYVTRDYRAVNMVFNAEYPMIRWLEANGTTVAYTTGLDGDRRGALIRNHKVFLSVGHDEYWSGPQRAAVEAARDCRRAPRVLQRQRHVLEDPLGAEHRRLANAVPDVRHLQGDTRQREDRPADRTSGPARGATHARSTPRARSRRTPSPAPIFTVNAWRNDPADRSRGVRAAALLAEHRSRAAEARREAVLGSGILGHEWNEDLDNGFRPPGLMRMSRTTVNNVAVHPGPRHDLRVGHGDAQPHALPRAQRRTGVQRRERCNGRGGSTPTTIRRPACLPSARKPPTSASARTSRVPEAAIRQATVNLFADMGVQPATLQPGLVAATASTDRLARPRASKAARVRSPAAASRWVARRRTAAAAWSPGSRCRSTRAGPGIPPTAPAVGAIGGRARLETCPASSGAAPSMTAGIWKADQIVVAVGWCGAGLLVVGQMIAAQPHQRYQLRLPQPRIPRDQRHAMDHPGRGNDLVCGIAEFTSRLVPACAISRVSGHTCTRASTLMTSASPRSRAIRPS